MARSFEFIKVDENLPDHPRTLAIDDEYRDICLGILIRAMCYSSRHLTDGLVPRGFFGSSDQAAVKQLLQVGYLEEVENGIQIHDYTDWNRSRAQVQEYVQTKRAAGKKGGQASARSRREATACGVVEAKRTQIADSREQKAEKRHQRAVSSACERALGRTLSSSEIATVTGWERQFDESRILKAIDIAVARGKARVNYIGSIIPTDDTLPAPEADEPEQRWGPALC